DNSCIRFGWERDTQRSLLPHQAGAPPVQRHLPLVARHFGPHSIRRHTPSIPPHIVLKGASRAGSYHPAVRNRNSSPGRFLKESRTHLRPYTWRCAQKERRRIVLSSRNR